MTNMRRITVSLPDDIDSRIVNLKKEDRFARASYAEVVRRLLREGLLIISGGEDDPEKGG